MTKKEKKSEEKEFKEEKMEKKEKTFCPKCGPGTKMAEHENRYHCGKCGYTRWK